MEAIIPVLMQSNTCLLAITTPRDSEHFFSALLKLADEDGNLLFNILRIGNPCESCMAKEKPWLCSHKVDELPPWKSMNKQKKYGTVYANNQDINMKEQWGIEADATKPAFKKEHIESFKNRQSYKLLKPPDVIWMACDPAGAGKSENSISAAVFVDGAMVVFYLIYVVLSYFVLVFKIYSILFLFYFYFQKIFCFIDLRMRGERGCDNLYYTNN